MIEIINQASKRGLELFGDVAAKTFYKNLKEHKFTTSSCKSCQKIIFPPRNFCPYCQSDEIEWIELSGRGKLYAFTQQERATRFMKPEVIGIVELEEGFLLVSHIAEKFEDLKIGDELRVSFLDVSDDFTLHKFEKTR